MGSKTPHRSPSAGFETKAEIVSCPVTIKPHPRLAAAGQVTAIMQPPLAALERAVLPVVLWMKGYCPWAMAAVVRGKGAIG